MSRTSLRPFIIDLNTTRVWHPVSVGILVMYVISNLGVLFGHSIDTSNGDKMSTPFVPYFSNSLKELTDPSPS